MARKLLAVLLVLSVLVIGILGCATKPGVPKQFSAENVMKAGERTMTSILYFGGDKWRVESQVFGQNSIVIVRTDKKVMWNLMPDKKMYMEMKLDPKQAISNGMKFPGEIKRKKVGSGQVNGIACDKYEITYKPNEKSPEASVYQWLSKDNVPVKTTAIDGSWSSEYKNIKVGRQPDPLFNLPAGYKKFAMPKMKL
ncbi:MAG: DUF4412 domain-containing protein [Candidatus Margulisbacteria bacterium]|nr:DUF4412 domain-containing protein [Candidatus Margulisiibacteriota bacterium]